jgi:PBP1b-binding outer membrane lipoprotein LpoB
MKLSITGLVLVLALLISSCSKNEKSATKPKESLTDKMAGSWRTTTQEIYSDGDSTIDAEKVSTLKFRDDGKYEFEFELSGEDRNDIISVWEENGVWTMVDNILNRTATSCYENDKSVSCDSYFPTVVEFDEENLVLTSEIVLRHLNIDTTYVWVYQPLITR